MSYFDIIDRQARPTPKPPEPEKTIPMPVLSFDEIDAMQQQPEPARKKPGRPPKAKP